MSAEQITDHVFTENTSQLTWCQCGWPKASHRFQTDEARQRWMDQQRAPEQSK